MGEPFTPFLLGALGHPALAFAAIAAATFVLEDPATVATALLAADGAIAPALAITPVQTGWFSDTAVQGYDVAKNDTASIASKLAPTGRP